MSKKTKYEGKWLNFYSTSFTNSLGEDSEWEYAARTGSDGAAGIIAVVETETPQLVLVRQFRPPIDNYSLEFPAGLIDPGESVTAAALRELEEETGYTGKVVNVGPSIYSSPGMTDEFVTMVTIRITGKTEVRPQSDEQIEIFLVPLTGLIEELNKIQATGTVVDAKLWSFALGLSWHAPGK